MAICEFTAPFNQIVDSELSNSMFKDRKEIIETLNSLFNQGILEIKFQALTKREMKYLREFGHITLDDDRGLSFTGNNINLELLDLRKELHKKYLDP